MGDGSRGPNSFVRPDPRGVKEVSPSLISFYKEEFRI